MPPGLTLNNTTGVLAGTPTPANAAGTSLTIQATDANGCAASVTYNLKVCPVLTFAPATLPPGTVGAAYSQAVTAGNGVAP